jgi:hypothetical protein
MWFYLKNIFYFVKNTFKILLKSNKYIHLKTIQKKTKSFFDNSRLKIFINHSILVVDLAYDMSVQMYT